MKHLLDLLYPLKARCIVCGDQTGQTYAWLCDSCSKELGDNAAGAFGLEGMAFAYAPHNYIGPAVNVVHALKYMGITALAQLMAMEMANGFPSFAAGEDVILVPVPMHEKRRKKRGYNQAEVLARALSKETGIPCENALIRVKNTRQQAKLEHEARAKNVEGAFRVQRDVAGKTIVLVDDVVTTGSTVLECAKAVWEAGATSVSVVCYAKA